MSIAYNWAKKVIARREQKEKNKELLHQRKLQLYSDRQKVLHSFARAFVESQQELFLQTKSEFKEGDTVLSNWFGGNNEWNSSAFALQSHTPYEGPIELEILSVHVDTTHLADILEKYIEDYTHEFEKIISYDFFKTKIISHYPNFKDKIYWSYKVKITNFYKEPGDDKIWWNYGWTQDQLLNVDSTEAKLSKKTWKALKKRQKSYANYSAKDAKFTEQRENLEKLLNFVRKG